MNSAVHRRATRTQGHEAEPPRRKRGWRSAPSAGLTAPGMPGGGATGATGSGTPVAVRVLVQPVCPLVPPHGVL